MPEKENDVVVRVAIAAPPSVVFSFFSDPERAKRWLGDSAILNCVRGGDIRIVYPNGDVAVGSIESASTEKIVFSWGYENDANGIASGTTLVSIELKPTRTGTTLTLRHIGLETGEQRGNHLAGWRYYIGTLAVVAAAGAMKSFAQPAVEAYLSSWTETDAGNRIDLLKRFWNPDGVFKDGMGYASGLEALHAYIGNAQRFMPGVKLRLKGAVTQAHGHVLFGWDMIGENGESFGSGWNVGELDSEGRFLSIVGFANQ